MLGAVPALGVFVGAMSFGFTGFAFALFANAALALANDPVVTVPAVMVLADGMALTLLWEHRREWSAALLRNAPGFARASPLLLVAGVTVGTTLLRYVSPVIGRVMLALVILGFVLTQVRPQDRRRGERRVRVASVEATTFAGGLFDGWVGTGGVPVALHLTSRRLPPGRFIATILPYFFASDTVRAISYGIAGYWSRPALMLALTAAPFAVVGYLAGVLLRHRFSPVAFRAVVLALLTLYAVALLVRARAG